MMINSLPDDANAPLAYRETYQTFIKELLSSAVRDY